MSLISQSLKIIVVVAVINEPWYISPATLSEDGSSIESYGYIKSYEKTVKI